jgi:solute carrier family 25 thiamine pyrophosphate transporter 19
MREQDNALETIICGGVAGLVSRFFIAPLDVLKIRLQLQTNPLSNRGASAAAGLAIEEASSQRLYHGILHGFKTIIRQEGVRGLWKGNASAEILYVSYAASQFIAYEYALAACASILPANSRANSSLKPPASHAFIAGACAGCFATALTYPFDLLRTRFAARDGPTQVFVRQRTSNQSQAELSIAAALRHVVYGEGVQGLYRGLTPSLLQIMPYMGLLFGIYEPCRQGFDALFQTTALQSLGLHQGTGWSSAAAGALAGTLAKAAVFPLDVVRKRLQVQGPGRLAYIVKGIPPYTSASACFTSILKREGIRGMYRGLGVSLLKSAPSSAITLWTYDQASQLLHKLKHSYQAAH